MRFQQWIAARAKTVDKAVTEFKRLKDPTFEPVEENPYEARVVEESELIPFIERGYELVKELSDGRFLVKKQNRVS